MPIPATPPSAPVYTSSDSDDLAAEYDGSITEFDFGIVIGSNDSLDEYTEIENLGLKIMIGDNISRNMSTKYPGVISTATMELDNAFAPIAYSSAEDVTDMPSWYANILSDCTIDFAGCALVSTPMNSIYHDPDQDIILPVHNIPLYGHVNYPDGSGGGYALSDPAINDIEATVLDPGDNDAGFGGDYASADYLNPWLYDPKEARAMQNKYGFDGVTPASAEVADVTKFYMDDGIQQIKEMLMTGFTERQNIRKVTRQVDYRRNYEFIPELEPVESLSIVQQVVKMIDPMAPAPPPASTRTRRRDFERILDSDGETRTTDDISVAPASTFATGDVSTFDGSTFRDGLDTDTIVFGPDAGFSDFSAGFGAEGITLDSSTAGMGTGVGGSFEGATSSPSAGGTGDFSFGGGVISPISPFIPTGGGGSY
jgi:hypothetical protein